ncbi:MAG: ETC complex I subunit, partial [Parvularculaceae bacterium]|nr:ETC complex I subunit [Parvularculaceae bacterium]
FDSKDAAVAYCERQMIPYTVEEPAPARAVPKAYSDNFTYYRRMPWTH